MSVNLVQLVQMIKSGVNPQQIAMSMLENAPKSPMVDNLLFLAKNNNIAGIEQVARNATASQGKDFDKEFNSFKQMLGL